MQTNSEYTTAKNVFHDRHNIYSRAEYEYIGKPVEYNGFQIFKLTDIEYHVVKNGFICGMLAGPNGAKRAIDDPYKLRQFNKIAKTGKSPYGERRKNDFV